MLYPAQDAAGNSILCFKGTCSAPLKGCASPERDHHAPSPASPQGFTAWLLLPRWLVAIAELWKVKWHFELGIFGLSIKVKMIAEDSVNPSRGDGIMQLPTSIRSHWTGKNPNRNFQRSVTKHKALVWPRQRMRFPPNPPTLAFRVLQAGRRLAEPFGLILLWEF